MLGWFKRKFGKGKAPEGLEEGIIPQKPEEPVAAQETIEEPVAAQETIEEPVAAQGTVEEPVAAQETIEEPVAAQETIEEPVVAQGTVEEPVVAGSETDADTLMESEETVAIAAPVAAPPDKKGLFQRLKAGLAKTRDSFVNRMDRLFLGKKVIDPELLDDLEEILITSDLGVATAQDLLDDAREKVRRKELNDPLVLKEMIKMKILSYLRDLEQPAELVMPESGPFVIMVVGVNGVGKTTTIGKIAYKFVRSGQSVLLVAADTFRAAAIEQLTIWAERIGVDIVAQKSGADPSSVVYDALDYARPRGFDVIIIDTAGRLHTKTNLMEELKKIKRVIAKKVESAPHEIMLVLDATTGQNGISQARLFNEAVGVTGLTLTKLDGTAKGGIVINISREFQIPIRFIGIGEKMEDLRDFNADEFVEALFDKSMKSDE